jgi:hypothetical protein
MRLLILIVLKSSAGCHPIRITTLLSSDHVLRISLDEMFGSFQTVGFLRLRQLGSTLLIIKVLE